jgi:hypothetical protein
MIMAVNLVLVRTFRCWMAALPWACSTSKHVGSHALQDLTRQETWQRPTMPPGPRSEELDVVPRWEASPGIEHVVRMGGHRLEAEGIVIGKQDDRVRARDLVGCQVYERDLTADLRRIHKRVGSPDLCAKL